MTAAGRWLTAGEVAERAGVGLPAVSNWRKRHADSFPQPNPQGMFDSIQIDRWLAEQGKASEPQSNRGTIRIIARRNTLLSLAYVAMVNAVGKTGLSDPLAAAAAFESRQGNDWQGVLTVPLSDLEDLPPGEWASLAAYLSDLLKKAPAVEVFDRLIQQSADRALRRADPAPELIELLIAMAPKNWETFLTPTPGTGQMRLAVGAKQKTGLNVGVEMHEELWRVCRQRTLVNPTITPRGPVQLGDFFDPDFRILRGDFVVATPDYGAAPIPGSAAARWLLSEGASDRQSTDNAWLLRCRKALSDHGRALVVTSERGGYQPGAAQQVRHELLRTGSVEAIISLEPGLVPGRLGQSLLWVLQPPNPAPASVLLVNAAGDSPEAPHNLPAVGRTYREWRDHHRLEPVPGYAVAVPVLDLLADSVDVTPSRWTDVPLDPDTALGDAVDALAELTNAWRRLVELEIPRMQFNPGPEATFISLQELAAQHMLTVQRPRHLNRDAIQQAGPYPYASGVTDVGSLRVAGYLPEIPHDAVVSQPGDVVLATTGKVRATVDRDGGYVLGSSVWCIRPQSEDVRLAPDLLALLLSSLRIDAQTVGGTVRRLRHPKDVTIPLLGEDQAALAAGWGHAVAELRTRTAELTAAGESASEYVASALDTGVTLSQRRNGES